MSPISSERHRAEELRNLHTKFSVARSSWIFFFLRAKSHEKWSSSLEDPTIFLYSFYRICQSEIIKREKEKKTFLSFRLNRKKRALFSLWHTRIPSSFVASVRASASNASFISSWNEMGFCPSVWGQDLEVSLVGDHRRQFRSLRLVRVCGRNIWLRYHVIAF